MILQTHQFYLGIRIDLNIITRGQRHELIINYL